MIDSDHSDLRVRSVDKFAGAFAYSGGKRLGDLNTESHSRDFVNRIRSFPYSLFDFWSSLSAMLLQILLHPYKGALGHLQQLLSAIIGFRSNNNNTSYINLERERDAEQRSEIFNCQKANNIAVTLIKIPPCKRPQNWSVHTIIHINWQRKTPVRLEPLEPSWLKRKLSIPKCFSQNYNRSSELYFVLLYQSSLFNYF